MFRVLVIGEAKAIGLKSGSKVQVSAVRMNKKEYILIEKFPKGRLMASAVFIINTTSQ